MSDPVQGGDNQAAQDFLTRQENNPRTAERNIEKYRWLALKPGDRVLDIGCGHGADLMRMAPLVGADGEVVGLDLNPAMIEAASRRLEEARFGNARAIVGDANTFDFPDNSFDAAHTERMLIYLAEPGNVIREAARVLRPGGRLVCMEFDAESRYADLDDMELHDRVYQHGAGGVHRVGRQLVRLFQRAGLEVTDVKGFVSVIRNDDLLATALEWDIEKALAQGSVTPEEAVRFREMHRARVAAGESFMAMVSFMVKGVKPLDPKQA